MSVQLELDLDDGSNIKLELSDRVVTATVDFSDSCIICKGMLLQAEKVRNQYKMLFGWSHLMFLWLQHLLSIPLPPCLRS